MANDAPPDDPDAPAADPAAPYGTRKDGKPRRKRGVRPGSLRMPAPMKPKHIPDPIPEMGPRTWGAGLPPEPHPYYGWRNVPKEQWPAFATPSGGTIVVHPQDYGPAGQLTRASAAAILRPYGPEILRTYLEIMHSETAENADRLRAADSLANRLWGKPTEHVEISEDATTANTRDILAGLSSDDLRMLIGRMIALKDEKEIDVTPDPAAS